MKVKFKVSRERTIILASVLLVILLAVAIFPYIPFPIYSANYLGKRLSFRVNLRDASKVTVYPNEESVREEIFNQFVENITIVFKPGEPEVNAHYAVEVFEIVNKLATAYKLKFGYMPSFNVVNVTSYENLKGTKENPTIALIHPIYSNETLVRVEDDVIYIQGKNDTTLQKQLKNFDLAAVKFLITALDIRV